MKAMLLHTPQPVAEAPLEPGELPDPEPSPGQIRLQVRVCGVCHTDLHTVEGDLDLPRTPIVPGHQIVGIVDKVGEQATRFQPGHRAGVAWLNWTCGECAYCIRGLENLCPNARFTGLHAHGGYAQYTVVDERFAYPIPEAFSDEDAAPLLCAGIVGFRALRLSEIEPGGRLGLYGFGASAHLVIQVARHWECEVYVFTRSQEHRRLATELGAAWVGGAQDRPPEPLDAGVTFAPAGWIIPLALDYLRPGGTLAVNAIHMSPIPEMEYGRIYQERTLRSVTNLTRRDAEDFLAVAAEIPIRSRVEVFPLDQANQVLQRLKESQVQGAAVLEIG
jgi:alcohol dehydrogenase, propanol-preferring